MRSNLVDIDAIFVMETEKGLCVCLDGEHPDVWLPKSRVEYAYTGKKTPKGRRIIVVTLTEDLATEKELV